MPKWNIQVGARNNYYLQLKRNNLEPRIFIQNKINTHFTGQISFEKKSQIVSQVRESVINDLSLENYVWLLSDNSNYPIQNGNQYTLGFTYKKNSWILDIDTYYKTIDGITSLTFGFLNPTDLEVHIGWIGLLLLFQKGHLALEGGLALGGEVGAEAFIECVEGVGHDVFCSYFFLLSREKEGKKYKSTR